nr:hypothetical protein [Coxiella-like endosymbiont]
MGQYCRYQIFTNAHKLYLPRLFSPFLGRQQLSITRGTRAGMGRIPVAHNRPRLCRTAWRKVFYDVRNEIVTLFM